MIFKIEKSASKAATFYKGKNRIASKVSKFRHIHSFN